MEVNQRKDLSKTSNYINRQSNVLLSSPYKTNVDYSGLMSSSSKTSPTNNSNNNNNYNNSYNNNNSNNNNNVSSRPTSALSSSPAGFYSMNMAAAASARPFSARGSPSYHF